MSRDVLVGRPVADDVRRLQNQALDEGVLPADPDADHHVGALELGEEAGQVAGVVLPVGVQRGDHFAAGGLETGVHGRGETVIPVEGDDPHAEGGVAAPRGDHLGARVVGGAIVDEDALHCPRSQGRDASASSAAAAGCSPLR